MNDKVKSQPTARGLLHAIVRVLGDVFEGERYKTPYLLGLEELEAVRPEGAEADWSERDRAFWEGMQKDYNQHRMSGIRLYEHDLPLHELISPQKPEEMDGAQPPPFELLDGERLMPYILVKADSGSIDTPEGPETVRVILLIGIFDDDPENLGQLTVLEAIEKIIKRFREYPAFEAFMAMEPIRWYLQDETSFPFYYGVVDLGFQIPAPVIMQGEEFC